MDIYLSNIKKQSKRYEIDIKVDGKTFSFKISEDLLIEMMFFSTKPLKESEYKNFLNKLPLDSLVFEGERYIDKKIRSEKEIREHLYSLSTSQSLVDEAIKRLKKKNLIDDVSYKAAYLEYAIYSRRDGRIKIANDLISLGLNQYFEYPIDALKDNINALSIKYAQKNHDVPYKTLINKMKIHLLGKGYTETEIDKYMNVQSVPKGNDDELIKKDYRKLKEKYKDNVEKIKISLQRKGYSLNTIEKMIRGMYNE